MSPVTADARGTSNLQARVVAILTKPKDEWPVIAAEREDVVSLFKNYIALLAAIPAVCLFIGLGVIGVPFFGRLGMGWALQAGIGAYVSALVGCYISAIVIEKLAPTFNSSGDTVQALKLVAYSYTPVWVAGVLYLILALTPLALFAGLYAIYLFYLGVTPVMNTPKDKVIPYMVVSAIVIIVVNIVLRMVVRMIVGVPSYGMF